MTAEMLTHGSILVVDDNLDIRQALRDLLQHEGYSVQCVSDGAAALRCLREGYRPNAILLDVMMQGVDGERFRAEQAADPVIGDIPVIVVSANRRAAHRLVAQGAAAALPKPFRFEQLMNALACLRRAA